MKIWVLSDMHLEFADLRQPLAIPDADVCVVAGDLCQGVANGVRWLAEHIAPAMPTMYVAGNHEFYKGSIAEGLQDGRAAAAEFPNVHFLENDVVVIDGVRFIGATLWTDFKLRGSADVAMFFARRSMNDYRKITLQKKPWRRFVPEAAYRMHQESRRFIESVLNTAGTKTVVVTHHAPHENSLPPQFKHDWLSAAYASDLTDVIEAGHPALWVHGHVHKSCDYQLGDTRIVCNPRGYADENHAFDHGLIVGVGP